MHMHMHNSVSVPSMPTTTGISIPVQPVALDTRAVQRRTLRRTKHIDELSKLRRMQAGSGEQEQEVGGKEN